MTQMENTFMNVNVDLIKENRNQPRTEFNDDALIELGMSIEENGLIQPIILKKDGEKYELIAGERRLRASKLVGMETIPAIIKDVSFEESAKLAVIENIQREDLNPIEEAKAYERLMKTYNLTQEQLANELGKSRSYIGNSIRLLNLEDEVRDQMVQGKISRGHGRALLSIEDKEEQVEIAKKIVEEKLKVREIEAIGKEKKAIKKNDGSSRELDLIKTIEEDLIKTLGTKVKISHSSKKGKIEIEYYGNEDLDRILELINK